MHGIVSENGNGTYTVEYATTCRAVLHRGHSAGAAHRRLAVFDADLPRGGALGPLVGLWRRPRQATAGKLTEFNILAKDTYGNAEHASAGGNFSVVLRGPEVYKAKVVDALTGLYVVSYTPKKAEATPPRRVQPGRPSSDRRTRRWSCRAAHAPTSVVKCVDAGIPSKECPASRASPARSTA